MAQQRQPFRFRLPWIAAPQPAPAASRPSQTTQTQTPPATAAGRPSQGTQVPSQAAPSAPRSQTPASQTAPAAPRPSGAPQAPSQRAPFRPAGVATRPATQPTPSARPPSPSQSQSPQPVPRAREPRSSQGPVSPSRPASPSQPSSKVQQATKVSPQSPTSSRGEIQATKPTTITAPPQTSSQANLPSPTKKPLTSRAEMSQNSNDLRKQGSSKPSSDDPKPVVKTASPPKEAVDFLEEPKRQQAFEEPKVKASTKFTPQVSSPKQEPKTQVKEVYKNSYTEPKGRHGDPKKEAIVNKEVEGSKAHPLADEQGKHTEEEVYDVKEVSENIENTVHDAEREIRGHERVPRFPQKHAVTGGQKASSIHREIKDNLSKFAHKQGAHRDKNIMYEKPLSIVTLTGENIGATMHLGYESQNKKTPIHINRGYKINQDKNAETTTDGEGSSRKRKSGDTTQKEESATKSYVNNNVQGLNNSLVFNSTVSERNPGVHVAHYSKATEPKMEGKEREMLGTHKVEVTRTPADRLAYAPTIRRRCLRGLMMESSDSDPEKPRRHGCPVGCTQKSRDGTIDLL